MRIVCIELLLFPERSAIQMLLHIDLIMGIWGTGESIFAPDSVAKWIFHVDRPSAVTPNILNTDYSVKG